MSAANRTRMNKSAIALFSTAVVLGGAQASPTDMEFNLTVVEDSGSYYVYRYVLVNPSSSNGGITSVAMDLSTTFGTPTLLATTGSFSDLRGPTPPAAVDVGPDIPAGWIGMVTADPELLWDLPSDWNASLDSVAPGDSVGGFNIRSSYLPGLRTVDYGPTVESCCLQPSDTTEERWIDMPIDHEVRGVAVGPRYTAEEVSIDLIQAQLSTVCSDPVWIEDGTLCTAMADALDRVEELLDAFDYSGAGSLLRETKEVLQREREPGGNVGDNAYWLLDTNLSQLQKNVSDADSRLSSRGPPPSVRCQETTWCRSSGAGPS